MHIYIYARIYARMHIYVYVDTQSVFVSQFVFVSASAIIPTRNIPRYFEVALFIKRNLLGFPFVSIFWEVCNGCRNRRLFCAPRGANSRVRSRWLICCMSIASATCLQWQGDSAMARFIRAGKEEATDVKLTGGCGARKEAREIDRQ